MKQLFINAYKNYASTPMPNKINIAWLTLIHLCVFSAFLILPFRQFKFDNLIRESVVSSDALLLLFIGLVFGYAVKLTRISLMVIFTIFSISCLIAFYTESMVEFVWSISVSGILGGLIILRSKYAFYCIISEKSKFHRYIIILYATTVLLSFPLSLVIRSYYPLVYPMLLLIITFILLEQYAIKQLQNQHNIKR